jgi:hypothetical protein
MGKTMTYESLTGRKFNGCHQLAVLLTQHMTPRQAIAVCRENGWHGVGEAVREQARIVTAQPAAAQRVRH